MTEVEWIGTHRWGCVQRVVGEAQKEDIGGGDTDHAFA